MSGGYFDYDQYRIGYIADSIEKLIENNGKKKEEDELYGGREYYEKYPDELYHHKYPDEIIEKFKEAVKCLRISEIYAQRIDYLVSSDDGEESFKSCLNEELSKFVEEPQETWEEIEEEYLKDEYPVFGGPFDKALSFKEWLKKWYEVPKLKTSSNKS